MSGQGRGEGYPQNKQGFTLLEIVITASILILIGAIAFVSFTNSRNIRDLNATGINILSVLQRAQSKTLASEDGSSWGVHLENARYLIFKGPNFAGATSTQEYVLPPALEISAINLLGGGADVVFDRLTGRTSQSGTFEVRIHDAVTLRFPITVDASGRAYQTANADATSGTRIVDTRHRAFDLGWSIQNSATTTLVFSDPPNPDTVQNIAMASYFDAGLTKFDLFKTISVGGRDQEFRIHTTYLSSANTILSIDRDCRKNSKKVRIEIDAKAIATYEADCATITVGAFGGVMGEP